MAGSGKIIMQVLLEGAEQIRDGLAGIGKAGQEAFTGLQSGATAGSAALKSIDDATKGLGGNLTQVSTAATATSSGIGSLGAASSQAGGGLSSLGAAATNAALGIAAIGVAVAGVTTALFAYASSAADSVNKTADLAQATGASVQQIAGLQFALSSLGVDAANTGQIIANSAAVISQAYGEINAKVQTDANAFVDANLRMRQAVLDLWRARNVLAGFKPDNDSSIIAARQLAVLRAQIERTRALEAAQKALAESSGGLLTRLHALAQGHTFVGNAAYNAALTSEQFRQALVLMSQGLQPLGDAAIGAGIGIRIFRAGVESIEAPINRLGQGLKFIRAGMASFANTSGQIKPPPDALLRYWLNLADVVSKIKDPLERFKRVQDALKAKPTIGLVNALAEGREKILEIMELAKRLGFIIPEKAQADSARFAENLQRIKDVLGGLSFQSKLGWVPVFAAALGVAADALERFLGLAGDDKVDKFAALTKWIESLKPALLAFADAAKKAFDEFLAGSDAVSNATFGDRIVVALKGIPLLLQEIAAVFNSVVKPAFVALGGIFDALVQKANQLFGTNFSTRAAAITAAVLLLTGTFGLLGKVLAPITALLSGIIGSFGLFGAAVAGLGLLVFWDDFKKAGEEAWRSLTVGAKDFQAALEFLKTGDFSKAFDSFRTGMAAAWDDFKRRATDGESTIGGFGRSVVTVVNVLHGALKVLAGTINTVFGTELTAGAAGLLLAITALSGGFTALGGLALVLKFAFTAAGATFLVLGAALIRLATLFPDITKSIENIKNAFIQFVSGDIKNGLENLRQAFAGFWDNLRSAGPATWTLLIAGFALLVKAILAGFALLAANPLTATFTLIAAGILLIANNWEAVKKALNTPITFDMLLNGIRAVITAIGPVKVAIVGLATAAAAAFLLISGATGVGAISTALAGAGAAIAVLRTGLLGLAALAWANPIIAALGVLAGAILLIALNWETVKAALNTPVTFQGTLEGIRNILRAISPESFLTAWNAVVGILNQPITFQGILDGINYLLGYLPEAFKNAWNYVVELLNSPVTFQGLLDGIKNAIAALLKMIGIGKGAGGAAREGGGTSDGPGLASGGLISGPRSGYPVMLHGKEYVHNPRATAYYGTGVMSLLNQMRIPKEALVAFINSLRGFADGGFVGAASTPHLRLAPIGGARGGGSAGHLTVDLRFPGASFPVMATPDVAREFKRWAVSQQLSSTGRKPSWFK